MRYLFFLLVSSLICTLNLTAQSHEVSGTVKDGNNEVVTYANVYLLQISDSTIVKGASSNEEGKFVITNVAPEIYFITASYIGQKSKLTPIDIRQDISVGSLVIENTFETLDEVIVVAQKPTIQRKVDRVVFNVENTVLSQSSSWDILKRTPGVIMVQDELKIGSQTPVIYLNDRKVQLSQSEVKDLLEGLSGTNIKSIEVIRNPPARYDAEGGPILNIVTSKNITPGYKGSINGNYTQAIFAKYQLGTSHYFKGKKLNVFANYTISPRKDKKRTLSDIHYIDNTNTNFSTWKTDFNQTYRSLSHAANVILDYIIDDKNSLNLTVNGVLLPKKEFMNNLTGTISNGIGQLDSTITNFSMLDENNHNLGIDLSYKHNFKKEGASISFNGHYTNYLQEKSQEASSDYADATGNFLRNYSFFTDAMQDINIATGQLDYASPIGKASFEMGSKISNIQSASGIDYFNVSGNTQTPNPSLSDDFKYTETVIAGYASITRNWKKWTLKAGLRGEQTDAKGVSLTLNSANIQKYFELFPSAYFLYTPSENHNFAFNYSRTLDRPRYNDLNPFRNFLNENDFELGNPNLTASFTNEFKLDYTLKNDYFIGLYYRDNGHYISSLAFQDPENQTLRSLNQNLLGSISYGLDFTVNKSITKNWYLYAYTSAFYEDEMFLAVESDNVPFTNKINGLYIQIANYLTLSNDGTFTGELGFYHYTGLIGGSYIMEPQSNLSFGLRKTLWNNRMSLSIQVEDILNTVNPDYLSKYLNQYNGYSPISETQFVRFGFSYKFGNFKLQDNEKHISKNERDRI